MWYYFHMVTICSVEISHNIIFSPFSANPQREKPCLPSSRSQTGSYDCRGRRFPLYAVPAASTRAAPEGRGLATSAHFGLPLLHIQPGLLMLQQTMAVFPAGEQLHVHVIRGELGMDGGGDKYTRSQSRYLLSRQSFRVHR